MSVKRDFSGKVVLITGSSSGIGAQNAIDFVRSGAQVVITGRNAKKLSDVGKQCSEVSPKKFKPLEVVADVSKAEECKKLIEATIKAFGKLDILVNNAGAGILAAVDDEKILEKYDTVFNTNLRSVVYLTNLAIKHLEKTKGNVVNISSYGGLKPFATLGLYCMTKAALDMYTKTAALELGPKGIRVNSVNPAGVRTNFAEALGIDPAILAKNAEEYGKDYPLGRIGEPSDVSNAIQFLASDEASWITGIQFLVDGGALNAPRRKIDLKK